MNLKRASKLVNVFSAWVNLGYPPDATENHGKFVGSVTRVNVWTRVLDFENDIPTIVEKCQSSPVRLLA